jgi:2-oxoglutarate dehydrogenase E1 component
MVNLYRDALDAGDCVVERAAPDEHALALPGRRTSTTSGMRATRSKVEMKRLQELAKRISTVPEAIEMQSRVAKIYADRQSMAAGNEKLFDWGGAETLAYATLVDEGIPDSPVR